ncbi:hypothetical protein BASA50_003984 [Batrachochytrium salamandrivorans]|uniref:MICOS complex subunit MIC12 n=1 Tax=Batrachochytrium salamandrivorans TaxID=1357716 RepID=A0ABQ8FI48_9FUNG|nr:hypothetical protein BASA60_009576 [Batrachochytrium salamandrivorans]KAH6567727.1 hypothetical protein BASA62_005942 [Batrachochytrium salamandrivorans]KAH6592697.1 hypothetical protein BASA61_004463 [Batrachochytrium salamandrivorans]KAH6598103.1 hypothetical protein BASA50_003984 [Batrachochytrium salamandrivorans]KAH9249012.1 hypothetical protein BASA81_013308 [Batrachochytrium salamandrivorans]
MASRLGVGFLAGVLTTTTAYSLMQASLASDTEVLNHALVSSRMQVESVLPAHLQSTTLLKPQAAPTHPSSLWPASWRTSNATPINAVSAAFQLNTLKENWNSLIRSASSYINGSSS